MARVPIVTLSPCVRTAGGDALRKGSGDFVSHLAANGPFCPQSFSDENGRLAADGSAKN